MTTIRLLTPKPQPCHNCEVPHASHVCPHCETPRPAWVAMKKLYPAKPKPPACRYFPKTLCDCGLRGICLSAA